MENKQLTLGSLFDGSGGFPLGGLLTGQITPVWSSEIEPFAIRVTTRRLPWVKHYGDVSAISGADLPPVDIITFGSPCQDMSIAGKRDGLDGSRSSLFYEAIRIVKEMRCKTNGEKPRFIVWENVPGAFSSNKGHCAVENACHTRDGIPGDNGIFLVAPYRCSTVCRALLPRQIGQAACLCQNRFHCELPPYHSLTAPIAMPL